jgi:hypothetical protein
MPENPTPMMMLGIPGASITQHAWPLAAITPRPTTTVQAPVASGSAPTRPVRTTAASRAAARSDAAPTAATTGAGSAIGARKGGAAADHTAAQDDAEDKEEEVTGVAPAASTMTNTQMQQVISLLNSIQVQDSQSAQSSLTAILPGSRQVTPVVQTHPTPGALIVVSIYGCCLLIGHN